jgi:hypothetical protein
MVMANETAFPEHIADTTHPAGPAPSRRFTHLRESLSPLGIVVAMAIVGVLIPKLHFLLWQLPYLCAPVMVTGVFNYIRDCHPDHVPAPLPKDSPLLTRLRRIKTILNRIVLGSLAIFAATLFGGLSGLLDRLSSAACLCETHPLLIVWILFTPAVLGTLGSSALSAYIKERTAPPPPSPRRTSSWLPTQARIYKSLQSNHWGQK